MKFKMAAVCKFKFNFCFSVFCRTHSIILVDTEGHCEFIEKTMKTPVNQNNVEWETTAFTFKFHNTNDTTSHL